MIRLLFIVSIVCFNFSIANASQTGLSPNACDVERSWGLKDSPHEMAIAVIAVGLTPEDIASQVGILAEGITTIKKIVISFPDQNIDELVINLQRLFPNISISVQYQK